MKRIFKNKEFMINFVITTFLTLCSSAVAFFFHPVCGALVLCFGLAVGALHFYYTFKRYEDINRLSRYLYKLCNDDKLLDIRDNSEGELSILKNNIYKTAVKLNTQTELMNRDKNYLADSLADISHQIKTPVASMMIMVDLLGNPELDEEKRREFINNISMQLEKIQWIITNLLKLSKLDSNTIVLKRETVNMEKLITSCVGSFLILMDLKNQELDVSGDSKAVFRGDFNWSVEAVSNIIKNCIEHTPENGKLKIRYTNEYMYTLLTIEDNGIGIDPEDIPHIFERFYKGANSSVESVGIGLALTKVILNREKASVEVESIGSGTKFTIKFYDV